MAQLIYLWDADYPWDIRTEKVCQALSAANHEVHIVCRNRRWEPLLERRPEATVHRLPRWTLAGRRLDGILSFPAFFSPRWILHLDRVVRRTGARAIIARDLPLCATALLVARRHAIPVVLDMAEVYPALLRDVWDTGRRAPLDFLIRNPEAAAWLEGFCLPRVTATLTVVEEARDHVLRRGASPGRTYIVSNTPPLSRLECPRTTPPEEDRLRVAYMGLMEVARGIGVLLEAATLLKHRGFRLAVELIGGGRDLPLLRDQARRLGLVEGEVTFHGYIPSHGQALGVVGGCHVGAAPHYANDWANTTIPNKLYDYMAAGMPVLVSSATPMKRIVTATGAGLVFRDRSPEDLANCLLQLSDRALRERLGSAGRAAVRAHYNWERDASVLATAVQDSLTS